MPNDDYVQTALRMAEAGEALVPVQPRSACYLLGYVAECTLKAAALKALTDQGFSPPDARQKLRKFVSHDLGRLALLHRLLALTPSARLRRLSPLDRLAPRMSAQVGGGPEEHWSPDHRYDGGRWDTEAARDYQADARRLVQTLMTLQLDGAL